MLPQGSRLLLQLKSSTCRCSSIRSPVRKLSGVTPAKRDPPPPDFAFAFDIDGVLLRSAAPISGASRSLTYLQHHHIPFILLTNGGGKHESERVAEISASLSLSVPLTTKNFIQSHTPIADFLHTFPKQPSSSGSGLPADSTVLVVGGESDKCRLVAESYGFQNVLTPGDIFAAHPEIWPFSRAFAAYYSPFARPLSKPINPNSTATPSLKVDAIFVFNDPRDWALDIQLILDILLSESGIVGTVSAKNGDKNLPNKGYQQDGQPPLYFSNPDLLWAAGYHLPRLGQGGFQHALEGVWRRLTHGAELQATVIGKPSPLTYSFAERKLRSYRHDLNVVRNEEAAAAAAAGGGRQKAEGGGEEEEAQDFQELKKVYMVGDNPESDIMGANNYTSPHGTEWLGVLVKTGVFTQEQEQEQEQEQQRQRQRRRRQQGAAARYDFDARPELEPKVIVEDVQAAVHWALKDSCWKERIDM